MKSFDDNIATTIRPTVSSRQLVSPIFAEFALIGCWTVALYIETTIRPTISSFSVNKNQKV
jgi:hypothetical protein